MTTGAELAAFADKKLMGAVDFNARLLRYLQAQSREGISRLFIQGSFDAAMTLTAAGAGRVRVNLKPSGDGMAHDGAGHLLNLAQLSSGQREATFENTNAVVYQVGAGYVEYPKGIRVNPSTGRYEYECLVEGIGEEATPQGIVVNAGTLRFRVDSLFETGGGVSHAGQLVRVFKRIPGDVANAESVAIEIRPVAFVGGQNEIVTTGLLGQTVPSTTGSDYAVQLVGLSVLRSNAANSISARATSMFYVGSVTGNGGTPSAFNITGQAIIGAQTAGQIIVTAPPPGQWADGQPIIGGSVQSLFNQVVAALTSGDAARGAGKITMAARVDWADGTTNPASTVATAIAKIVSDLVSTTGDRGAGKLTAPLRGDWADGTTNPATTVAAALAKIVSDLVSTTGARGAGKITVAARSAWADDTTNSATTVATALARIISDLVSTTGARGAGKLTAPALFGGRYALPAMNLASLLQSMHNALHDSHAAGAASRALTALVRSASLTANLGLNGALSIARHPARNLLLLGNTSGVALSHNGGTSFEGSTTGISGVVEIRDVFWSVPIQRWLFCGTAIWISADDTAASASVLVAAGFSYWGNIVRLVSGTLVCVKRGTGAVARSTNNGLAWSVASPAINGGNWSVTTGDERTKTATRGGTVVSLGNAGASGQFVPAQAIAVGTNDGQNWTTVNLAALLEVLSVPPGTQNEMPQTISVTPDGSAFVMTVGVSTATTKILASTDGLAWSVVRTFGLALGKTFTLSEKGPVLVALDASPAANINSVSYASRDGFNWTPQAHDTGLQANASKVVCLEGPGVRTWALLNHEVGGGGTSFLQLRSWAEWPLISDIQAGEPTPGTEEPPPDTEPPPPDTEPPPPDTEPPPPGEPSGMLLGANTWFLSQTEGGGGWAGEAAFVDGINWATAIGSFTSGRATSDFWNPAWIAQIAPYNYIRFMDWGQTNFSAVSTWSQRRLPTANQYEAYSSYDSLPGGADAGMAYEWMIDLCNRHQKDMWVCVPHQANDAYVTSLATLIRDRLDNTRKCYVEYSNETWNFGGGIVVGPDGNSYTGGNVNAQLDYTMIRGAALNLPGDNLWYKGGAYSLLRSLQIFEIFETVYGSAAMGTRVMRTVSASGNLSILDEALANIYQSSTHNPGNQEIDLLCSAPYVWGDMDGASLSLSAMTAEIDDYFTAGDPAMFYWLQTFCTNYGIPRWGCYEGGMQTMTNANLAAANVAIMKPAYRYMLDELGAGGCYAFSQYTHTSTWGPLNSWGAVHNTEQDIGTPGVWTDGTDRAPKYEALWEFWQDNLEETP